MARDEGSGGTSKGPKTPKNLPQYVKAPTPKVPAMLAKPSDLPKYNNGNQVNRPSWASGYEKAAAQRRLNETIRTAPTYLPLFRSTAQGAQQFDPARQAEINNYRDNVLTGKAFGYPGNYMTPGVMNQDYGYVRAAANQRTAPQREAWSQALDYQDAADRRSADAQYKNTIKTFGGIGGAIAGAATNVANGLKAATQPDWKKKWADVMATQWPTYGPPAPDASPWVAQGGGGGGGYADDGGYGGYGGRGGGGGGGGYPDNARSWLDMYQWRF